MKLSARWCRGLACFLALMLGACGYAATEREAPAAEYQLKAVFLFNFAQFVDWPAGAFSSANAPLVIGILGDDPFGGYLDDLVREELISGRPLRVRRLQAVGEVDSCHILYISRSESSRYKQVLAGLRRRPLLTVGEGENFCRLGGIVRFVTEQGKIRLRINVETARGNGLVISTKLLRWATIVVPDRE